ncbi:aminoglycoside phosphotransferase family protein [Streptomyces durocortorensis]|uniref:Aminoglycoside phosphotransferase family protein n=1 Tax=Streptomyces durocortorensis TaxID=2811104 RepID=A0ABS2HX08_9ACTN|nr:aminoglycoside phosphotransferase family protein [Streptomyces durocortorensis]MBM7055170.1 aminoglycoside phosphotransferase family protein [Streptomyces durocortorensis]
MIIEPSLVRGLIAAQFPHWADLPVEAVDASGTANAIYRLGTDKAVRLPRTDGSAADVATEHRWLPRLAEQLPFPVPLPLAQGAPDKAFPRPWSVCTWLDGTNPGPGDASSSSDLLAADLAELVLALRRIDPAEAPPAHRSEPLASRDPATREALAALGGVVDAEAVAASWKESLSAPPFADRPVWVHGDLQPGNVLVADGRLNAVIDFGCTGLADPAVDLIAAWYLLTAGARETFRTAIAADDATWTRGRGWALSIALLELAHYRETNPVMARIAAHVIEEVVAEVPGEARA